MVVTVREGYQVYEIDAPLGSRIERDQFREWLVITGHDPHDTWIVVPWRRLLGAAYAGLYGLSVRRPPVPASLS